MNIKEAINRMLKECGLEETGEGLIPDAKTLAKACGIEFNTLRETVDILAPQFNISLKDESEEVEKDQGDFWDRIVEANTAASAFGDDDGLARTFGTAEAVPSFTLVNTTTGVQSKIVSADQNPQRR